MTTWTVASNNPRYGETLAMIARCEVRFLGERYTEEGRVIAVRSGEADESRSNPEQIKIGREFFTTALKDYKDWQEKWWREVVQNAVDAGAKNVELFVERYDDGTVSVSCVDDGKGMSEDTILNKFLVLGASTKAGEAGQTGGFGKAKELILLPWLSWKIHTGHIVVEGSGIDYEVKAMSSRISGTRISCLMPASMHTTDAAAISFLKKCWLPDISFKLSGPANVGVVKVKADLESGEHKRDVDGGKIYYNNKAKLSFNEVLVRSNGLYMFGTGYVPPSVSGSGVVVFDLTGRSIDYLTANRDGFRDNKTRWAVDGFLSELSIDVKSALRKKAGGIRKKFEGQGKFSYDGSVVQEMLLNDLRHKKGKIEASSVEDAVKTIERATQKSRNVEKLIELLADPGVVRAILSMSMPAGTETQVMEAAAAQLSWEPDFFIINEPLDTRYADGSDVFQVPKFMFPEHMPPQLKRLARLWAELCRFVMIQLGCKEKFGIGWIFSESQAAYLKEGKDHWLLLNPYNSREVKLSELGKNKRKGLYGTSEEDLKDLYAMAIHECTHMADGINYHDEAFAAALTWNMAKCSFGKDKIVRAIRRAVVARKFDAGKLEQDEEDPALPDVRPQLSWRLQWAYHADREWEGGQEPFFHLIGIVPLNDPSKNRTQSVLIPILQRVIPSMARLGSYAPRQEIIEFINLNEDGVVTEAFTRAPNEPMEFVVNLKEGDSLG